MSHPIPAGLRVRAVAVDGDAVWLHVDNPAPTATCPGCGEPSDRVHGRYLRRPAGLARGGYAVRFALEVRSFRCANPACRRATFAEDFGDALPGRARRTKEATAYLLAVALRAGAEAGSRLAAAAGVAASPDTLLRLRRAAAQDCSGARHERDGEPDPPHPGRPTRPEGEGRGTASDRRAATSGRRAG